MIEKTKIINGLYFVSIPKADLYIQCGSPVESVKHLSKAGIIKNISKDDFYYESGPNAILLSDIMIQNGEFCNVSEFSVLQMLYKQGLIIPNHPNNNGSKPILIGNANQINSQIEYIYRGNYGLVSHEEIQSCGIDKNYADELMKMKLKFAFGKLHSANNLLDCCYVLNDKLEIKNGVFIERKELNMFEISYEDETITVDLNLKESQSYPSPYNFVQDKINREYFSIVHSGQGDGWDFKRPSMNSLITFKDKLYLVDVVPNIKHILKALSVDINEIDGVFVTHTHDDHLAGIPSLIRSDKLIKFYATPLVILAAAKKLSALLGIEEFEFYNFVDVHPLKMDEWNDLDGLEVRPELSPHPVETTTFKFRVAHGDDYKSYGYFADIISEKVLKGMITNEKNTLGVSESFYNRVFDNYLESMDLKKIDIGGGMIHGVCEDFKDDTSSKMILSHISEDLITNENKSIGKVVSFGYKDVLISSNENYDYKLIEKYLKINFPTITDEETSEFSKLDVIEFEPSTIIVKENTFIDKNYLILSGQVELLEVLNDEDIVLTPGTIISNQVSFEAMMLQLRYTAKSYVKALEIPNEFYNKFKDEHCFSEELEANEVDRSILITTKLFNEQITYSTLNQVIKTLKSHTIKDEVIEIDPSRVYIIITGRVDIKVGEEILETITNGDYFGGVKSLLNYPSLFNFNIAKNTLLYSIDAKSVERIPVVRWKILERYSLKKEKLFTMLSKSDEYKYSWKQEYLINICEMDNQHKRVFEIIDNINICLKSKDCTVVELILDTLIDYIEYHFSSEEKFLEKYGYKEYKDHKQRHDEFKQTLYQYKKDIKNKTLNKTNMMLMLQSWMVNHILQDDKKYAKYLNEKGIF
jgi:hemerythrin